MISDEILNVSTVMIKDGLAYTNNGCRFVQLATIDAAITASHHDGCRDRFAHRFFRESERIGLIVSKANPGIRIARLNALLERIETRLGLKARTAIHVTNEPNLIVLMVPKWWRHNGMRRSFYTLMLRLGSVYYNGQLPAAIRNYHLARECQPAIERFLAGFTHSKFRMRGWRGFHHFFRGADAQYVADHLF